MPDPSAKGVPTWLLVSLGALGLGVVALGVLGTLALSGTRKYVALSKAAEATSTVTTLGLDAARAYERDDPAVLCASASQPVPASMAAVSAKSYASSPAEWRADPAERGFTCLRFELFSPQHYQYHYRRTGGPSGSAPGDGYEAEARGDLDGDGVFSSFKTTGTIEPGGRLGRALGVTRVNEAE